MKSQDIYIAVNSQDRTLSGTPNKYTVNLPRLLRNVVSIELVSAEIPNSLYPDTIRNLYFGLDYPGIGLLVCLTTIPVGVWTHNDAATQMTNNIGAVVVVSPDPDDVASNATTVIEDEGDGKERLIDKDEYKDVTDINHDPSHYIGNNPPINPTLTSTYRSVLSTISFAFDPRLGKFYIQFPSGTFANFVVEMAQTTPDMGFTAHTYTKQVVGANDVYYANDVAQLWVTSHLWMTIDELGDMPYTNFISTNSLPRNVFARIQMATDVMHWVFWSQGFEEFKRVCAPGQTTNLTSLTIGWLDDYGNLVDFHGLEHSLMFKVVQSPPD